VSVTLREVLDLDPLRSAGPRVLSGHDRLDQPVRWVHVAELPDIAYLLSGGELVLTTGMGIAGSAEVQRRYVAELAEAGAAGVVIELGRNFQRIPAEMVRAAEQRGLPVIALAREARYVEVTETVHRAIINRQYELLSRAESVSRELTELILSGAGLGRIIARLAEIFGNHVVLEDGAHQVVEIGGTRAGLGTVLGAWEEHSRSGHEEVDRGVVHRHEEADRGVAHRHEEADRGHRSSPRCMWVGLWLRHDPWGRLHVLETETRFHEITELLVDRAGAALGLALLSEKDATSLADRAGSALIGEVVAGRHGSTGDLLRRARSLGADIGRGRLAAVAIEVAELPEVAAREALSEEERLQIRVSVVNDVRGAAPDHGASALIGLLGDRVMAVVDVRPGGPLGSVLDEILQAAAARVSARHPSLSLVAGASGEAAKDSLHRAAEEATVALGYGRRRGQGRVVTHFPELGTYQLLARLAQGPDLALFVESELRPLLDHDSRARSKLIPTLRAYLDNAGRKAGAVRALGIQRRTLYARIERISGLLGRDLDAQDTRTRLTLALQGLDLLRERGPTV
jgi:PucR family transcriptional regulator, purine catabolism regulatory protein